MSLDRTVMVFLDDHRDPVLTTVARGAMYIGTGDIAIAAWGVAGLVVVVAGRWWRVGLTVGGAVLVAQAVARLLKAIIARPRPPADLSVVQVGAWSMPSTVAAMTAALAAALLLSITWPTSWVRWSAATVLTVFVIAAGSGTVYLGAHWPSDVLVGWILGAGVGGAVVRLVTVCHPRLTRLVTNHKR
ncbi:phosphatase PAP2 family protein [Nocardia sp. NPDC052566]|uniref:phosphatase PAP2 family protein n=1 Tax=Nocardia sp. NPDC052566 TaxID=3364330 RepID=UPI0037C8E974